MRKLSCNSKHLNLAVTGVFVEITFRSPAAVRISQGQETSLPQENKLVMNKKAGK
jgi:hypothetical protein